MRSALTEAFDCLFYSDRGDALVAKILDSAESRRNNGMCRGFEEEQACLDVLIEIAWVDPLLFDRLLREGLKAWDEAETPTGLSRDSQKQDDPGRNAFHRRYIQKHQQRLSLALGLLCRSYGNDFVSANTVPLGRSLLRTWLGLRPRSIGGEETIGELLEKRIAFWNDVDRHLEAQGILGVEPRDLGYLETPIVEMNWTVRTAGCLQNASIVRLRDLVRASETDVLRIPAFGKKSLHEVAEELSRMGLALGLHVDRDRSC